ncbi:hypothetical protein N7520_009608 [Penicillium odoratum]|uniref:uncharacterized protein n=1 Tax=Penicillium odoratum TaxID=1167516 RepID=UPI0025471C36|nr:uncharacterized protein N7520_009608 [Penicillium odoratum]KAJ5752691.1 hypothetical protein N7520_009608 [Penicillium odoratum]
MPSIDDRTREDLLNKERDLWAALTSADPAPAVQKMCNSKVNMIFPQIPILTLEDESTFKDALELPFRRFETYQLNIAQTIIIGLMAGVMTYEVRAIREGSEYRATASTTWCQDSDGEWRVACHQETLL